MEYIPKDVAMATAALTGFNRNRYKLETSGATSAGPSSIVTITLPSNALIDLKSLRVFMDLKTDSDSTTKVWGKLPSDVSSVISSCEVYIGGVQVTQSCSEWNTVSKILKIVRCSRDRDGSVEKLLNHGIMSDSEAIDDVSVVLSDFKGFLGESSTRYLPTSLTGDVTIRLTFAPASVLGFVEGDGGTTVASVAMGANFSDAAARTAAAGLSYSATNIYATCDTISLGDTYERMLLDRLSSEAFLPINFKEYYTYSQHGTAGTAHTVRFSLSASSIDACYAIFRDSNYQTAGIKAQTYAGSANTSDHVSNYFMFKSFNDSNLKKGALRYHWTCANVRHPQYQANVLDAAADLSLLTNNTHTNEKGHMITSLQHFNQGTFILPLILNMPGQSINVASGYNSKGSNTTFSLEVSGQTMPSVSATAQTTAAISTFVVVETTAQLRISGSRQCSVSF